MACSLDHSKLSGLTFCEECGEKVGRTDWACSSGHEVEAQFKFCLVCGKGEEATKARPRNAYKPPVVSNNSDSQLSSTAFNQDLYSPIEISKKSNNTVKILLGVLGLFVIVSMFFGLKQAAVPETIAVSVTMVVIDESCYNLSWGYGDIPGGQVVITADGVQVGFGSYSSFGTDVGRGCQFEALVLDVPMDAENYAVSMASGRRGVIYNTKSELEANGWAFELSIG
jgi:hypothetical protein